MTSVQKVDVQQLLEVLKRVNCEHPTKADVEAFKRARQANPMLLAGISNIARRAQQHLADKVRGTLIDKESVKVGIERTANELGYVDAGSLERLLIDHVALCWARLYLLEQQFTNVMQGSISVAAANYWERKLSSTQARYLRAIETLARVRRSLRPSAPPVQVNIGDKQVNIVQAQPQPTAPGDPGELVALGEPRDLT